MGEYRGDDEIQSIYYWPGSYFNIRQFIYGQRKLFQATYFLADFRRELIIHIADQLSTAPIGPNDATPTF